MAILVELAPWPGIITFSPLALVIERFCTAILGYQINTSADWPDITNRKYVDCAGTPTRINSLLEATTTSCSFGEVRMLDLLGALESIALPSKLLRGVHIRGVFWRVEVVRRIRRLGSGTV